MIVSGCSWSPNRQRAHCIADGDGGPCALCPAHVLLRPHMACICSSSAHELSGGTVIDVGVARRRVQVHASAAISYARDQGGQHAHLRIASATSAADNLEGTSFLAQAVPRMTMQALCLAVMRLPSDLVHAHCTPLSGPGIHAAENHVPSADPPPRCASHTCGLQHERPSRVTLT